MGTFKKILQPYVRLRLEQNLRMGLTNTSFRNSPNSLCELKREGDDEESTALGYLGSFYCRCMPPCYTTVMLLGGITFCSSIDFM